MPSDTQKSTRLTSPSQSLIQERVEYILKAASPFCYPNMAKVESESSLVFPLFCTFLRRGEKTGGVHSITYGGSMFLWTMFHGKQ
jgi:hypothetical protein